MTHADRTPPDGQADTDAQARHLHAVPDPDQERRRQLDHGIDQLRAIRAQLAQRRGRHGS